MSLTLSNEFVILHQRRRNTTQHLFIQYLLSHYLPLLFWLSRPVWPKFCKSVLTCGVRTTSNRKAIKQGPFLCNKSIVERLSKTFIVMQRVASKMFVLVSNTIFTFPNWLKKFFHSIFQQIVFVSHIMTNFQVY